MSLQAQRPEEKGNSRPVTEMPTLPLYRLAYRKHGDDPAKVLEARVELQQRLALPMACLLLTLAGVPLGITSRRGGKSSAVVLTMAIAFVYFIGMAGLNRLAKQGAMRAEIAVWLPNLAFTVLGLVMLARLEFPGDRDYLARFVALLRSLRRTPQQHAPARGREAEATLLDAGRAAAGAGDRHLHPVRIRVLFHPVPG